MTAVLTQPFNLKTSTSLKKFPTEQKHMALRFQYKGKQKVKGMYIPVPGEAALDRTGFPGIFKSKKGQTKIFFLCDVNGSWIPGEKLVSLFPRESFHKKRRNIWLEQTTDSCVFVQEAFSPTECKIQV